MTSPIHHMAVIEYSSDGRHWQERQAISPTWGEVELAIRRMDNYCFPLVQLNPTDDEGSEDIFNIVGGNGRWALFQMMGDWQSEQPGGSDREVRLWESDQGYFCREKNVLLDIEKALRIVKTFFETASYGGLDAVP